MEKDCKGKNMPKVTSNPRKVIEKLKGTCKAMKEAEV